jgi:hypothetical protein
MDSVLSAGILFEIYLQICYKNKGDKTTVVEMLKTQKIMVTYFWLWRLKFWARSFKRSC